MGFFGSIGASLFGGNNSGGNSDPFKLGGAMSIMDMVTGKKMKNSSAMSVGSNLTAGGKPPVDNSHSHGSSGNTSTKQGSGGNDPTIGEGGGLLGKLQPDTRNAGGPPPVPNGIDNGQYEQEFMEKRGGVGISETPDVQLGAGGQVGVPVPPPDVDKMGVNSLY